MGSLQGQCMHVRGYGGISINIEIIFTSSRYNKGNSTVKTRTYHSPSSSTLPTQSLSKLLLNKERPQISQLPRTRHRQHKQLNQTPLHHPTINTLALIPKLRLPLPLKDLLAPHILQPRIQILHLLHHLAHLVLVRALDLARFADDHVELEADAADLVAAEEVAGEGGDVGRGEAEAVVAGVGGGEGEFAGAGAALRDDAVVVVEGFVDGDEDALDEEC